MIDPDLIAAKVVEAQAQIESMLALSMGTSWTIELDGVTWCVECVAVTGRGAAEDKVLPNAIRRALEAAGLEPPTTMDPRKEQLK